jgi:hypothetical protein
MHLESFQLFTRWFVDHSEKVDIYVDYCGLFSMTTVFVTFFVSFQTFLNRKCTDSINANLWRINLYKCDSLFSSRVLKLLCGFRMNLEFTNILCIMCWLFTKYYTHSPIRFKLTFFGPDTRIKNAPVTFEEWVVTTNMYVVLAWRTVTNLNWW